MTEHSIEQVHGINELKEDWVHDPVSNSWMKRWEFESLQRENFEEIEAVKIASFHVRDERAELWNGNCFTLDGKTGVMLVDTDRLRTSCIVVNQSNIAGGSNAPIAVSPTPIQQLFAGGILPIGPGSSLILPGASRVFTHTGPIYAIAAVANTLIDVTIERFARMDIADNSAEAF